MNIQPTPEGATPQPMSDNEDEAPAEQPQEPGGGGAKAVVDALKLLQAFVMGQKKQGNPKADEIVTAFQALLSALGAGGAPEQAPPQAEAPPPEMMGKGQMPMGAAKGSVPIV